MVAVPVYELAGQLDDPLAEEILATGFTDQPVRPEVRPDDNRRHDSWGPEDPSGQTSRAWITTGAILTDDATALTAERMQTALQVFVPQYAKKIIVTAKQTDINTIEMIIDVTRTTGQSFEIALLVPGGSNA